MARLAALVVAACAAFLAGGAAAGSSGAPGGLWGKVSKGPTRPVCVAELPCTKPAANTQLVFRRAEFRKTVRTDESGRYRITLRHGVYSVRVAASGLQPLPDPRVVRVPQGRSIRIDFSVDTGIR